MFRSKVGERYPLQMKETAPPWTIPVACKLTKACVRPWAAFLFQNGPRLWLLRYSIEDTQTTMSVTRTTWVPLGPRKVKESKRVSSAPFAPFQRCRNLQAIVVRWRIPWRCWRSLQCVRPQALPIVKIFNLLTLGQSKGLLCAALEPGARNLKLLSQRFCFFFSTAPSQISSIKASSEPPSWFLRNGARY